jgi:hypothetical protein
MGGPSRTRKAYGITSGDWFSTLSPEGGPVVPDPADSNTLYIMGWNGIGISRVDQLTREVRDIVPDLDGWREEFNQNYALPIVLSPHDPRTVYTGTTRLMRSTDRGEHWEPVSGILTRPPTDSVRLMGYVVPFNSERYPGGQYHALSTIAESPVTPGVLYVGTEDGMLHVTRDGGREWRRLGTCPGAPDGAIITRVAASRTAPGTAYLTVNGNAVGDYLPHVCKTTDFGLHWTPITNGLPPTAAAWVIVEHFRTPQLLFLGTDVGVFTSFDGGAHWQSLRNNMSAVQTRDLVVQPRANDLVLSTYGRGLWILDDITPLERLAENSAPTVPVIFPPRDALQLNSGALLEGAAYVPDASPNPLPALVSYIIPQSPGRGRWSLDVLDSSGHLVRTLATDSTPGLHRAGWDLRMQDVREGALQGTPAWRVMPGLYRVRLHAIGDSSAPAAGSAVAEESLTVRPDPKFHVTPESLDSLRVVRAQSLALDARLHALIARAERIKAKLDSIPRAGQEKRGDAAARRSADAIRRDVDETLALKESFRHSYSRKHPRTIANLLSGYNRQVGDLTTGPPSASFRALIAAADSDLTAREARLRRIESQTLSLFPASAQGMQAGGKR